MLQNATAALHPNVMCCWHKSVTLRVAFSKRSPETGRISAATLAPIDSMWNLMKKSIPSNLSAKSDLLMVYARAWQWRCIHKNADCQLFTTHALQRWRWKTKKRAPSFPGFPIIKSARHCGKITISKKKVRFMGTVSGPAGCLWMFMDVLWMFMDVYGCLWMFMVDRCRYKRTR